MMLNDRDDKSESDLPETPGSTDDTEYHFSDDDISYEVEPESTTTGQPTRSRDLKGSLLGRLNKSRRLIISLVVFLLLVFVVYKIVVPSTPTPTDTITPAAPVTTTAMRVPTAAPVTPRPQPPVVPTPTQPVTPVPTPPSQTPVVDMTQPQVSPPATQPMPPSVAPPQVAVTVPTSPPPTTGLPPTNQVTTPPTTVTTQPQQLPVSPQQIIASMPSVIPVQSTTQNQPTTYPPQMVPAPTGGVTTVATVQQEQMLAQLHAEYAQRINEFNSQNKSLQEDVQALSSRVASMEAQMNQLIQTLTRQQTPPTPPPAAKIEPPQPSMPPMASTRVPYTVQAIIPGRAWLRSDNGETVTVAEGDIVKGLGRITRIDPYDGIVEINTGTKVISLSYGSGG